MTVSIDVHTHSQLRFRTSLKAAFRVCVHLVCRQIPHNDRCPVNVTVPLALFDSFISEIEEICRQEARACPLGGANSSSTAAVSAPNAGTGPKVGVSPSTFAPGANIRTGPVGVSTVTKLF